ncbi:BQ5605_C001g00914 [Microbotryum silenes-dioicae]|uniref:BQ5605_C001g00914 protein n=1 Tax=Microbotryum silenes-dioicae TaxID=796604 RepID=A0A2X0MZ36_9BASI|nr:BQ5605_C001g00914 [Microbotryum silenes-dioicae]
MGWGGHWCTRPVPTYNRAKKQKSCLNSPARGSSFGWVNGPADLCPSTSVPQPPALHPLRRTGTWPHLWASPPRRGRHMVWPYSEAALQAVIRYSTMFAVSKSTGALTTIEADHLLAAC